MRDMGKVIRFHPLETDKQRDNWIEKLERQIDTELDNLIRYGNYYVYQVAHREGTDLDLLDGEEMPWTYQ